MGKEGSGPVFLAGGVHGASQLPGDVPGTRSPAMDVAVLYQHGHKKPGFLQQEAGIHINLDIGLNVARPPK